METKTSLSSAISHTHEPQLTTDHTTIRHWIEERAGTPAVLKDRASTETIMLRVILPGQPSAEPLAEVSWGEFFQRFEEGRLAFAFRLTTVDGERSNFYEIIRRDQCELE